MKYNTVYNLLFAILTLSACYTYDGPTHKPYQSNKRPIEYKQHYINKTYHELVTLLPEAQVQLLKDSIKILFPENIIYQSQEIAPSSNYEVSIQKLSDLLIKYKENAILITGYCDNTGKEEFNKKLSTKRAIFIKNKLISNGVASNRIDSWGLGSLSPIADNNTPEGRRLNRRVEFVVMYDGK